MKVYISGPMSGRKDLNREEFVLAEVLLRGLGHEVVNPHTLNPEGRGWVACMINDLRALRRCQGIYMLHDWATSRGARVERKRALDFYGLVEVAI
jgi:hypothetical protein